MTKRLAPALAKSLIAAACLATTVLPNTVQAADTYTQTKYPIVLVHGLFGFDAIGPIDYWYGIVSPLQSGGAKVIVSQVSAANSTEVRGEQLLSEIKRYQASYGYQKFNLIGHSHGGPTVRYVAAVAPSLVASITSVGGPHTGSPVADDIKAGTTATGTTAWVAAVFDAFAAVISLLSGNPGMPQDSEAAMNSLTTAGSAAFNAKYPAGQPTSSCGSGPELVNGVRYYSVGGNWVLTNPLDISDALLALTSVSFKGSASDGLVGQCSSHWGTVLKDNYSWNHLDEINQAFGLRGLFSQDPVAFYRGQANRLKTAGL
ncbi:triacylglycerol lipase [Ideonella azotifigens]|uniref:Triacylglycerol lipase n=1 Tax=Ideonella azotifigens TaxID=513160 RepID=A0ABP3V762_9BURK|nr:triacylglycerol lipase [Ideonella azotifigens]MCD2341188.1 triacylglycerol lipase [Ideonella azotifigens]